MASIPRGRRSQPEHLLRSARELFLRYGLKRTAMEDVARAAGVAKGTLYLAFDSKEALFRGVCAALCDEIFAENNAAVAGVSDPIERARRRLAAKYVRLQAILAASPHAAELVASGATVAADILRAADARFHALLAAEIADAMRRRLIRTRRHDLDAAHTATLLIAAARGCGLPEEGKPLPSAAVVKRRLNALLDLVFAGLRGLK